MEPRLGKRSNQRRKLSIFLLDHLRDQKDYEDNGTKSACALGVLRTDDELSDKMREYFFFKKITDRALKK